YYPGTSDMAAATEIDIPAGGELSGIDFRLGLQPAYQIRGRVIDSATGQFPENASLSLVPREPIPPGTAVYNGWEYKRADGTFDFRDVLPGSYWVRAQFPITRPLQPGPNGRIPPPPTGLTPIEISAADVEGLLVTIQPPISISGRVRIEGPLATTNLQQLR